MKNRTNLDMKVKFDDNGRVFEEWVYIPYDIFMECFMRYVRARNNVKIEGPYNSVWNLLSPSGFFEDYIDNEPDLVEEIKEVYYNSPYYEEDKEEFDYE